MAPAPAVAKTPEDRLLQVFETRCAECHRDDNAPELHAGINLSNLLQNEDMVTPGKAAKSLLYTVTMLPAEDRNRMPKNRKKLGDSGYRAPLTAEESGWIKDWINAAAGPAVADREPLSLRDAVAIIEEDVERLRPAEAKTTRYLSLANLYSLRDQEGKYLESDQQMEIYRAALSKLMNSISKGPEVVPLQAVDEARTVYRLNLRDYGMEAETWERIVRGYPYGVSGENRRAENTIAKATSSRRAYLRGDWFVFACAQPPLYHDILKLPANDRQLEKGLGIDVVSNLQNYEAIRAGFRNSGVSQANRMVERHEIEAYRGAYWKSYDFSPLNTDLRDDLFQAPLGPESAALASTKRMMFTHDGGEVIFNLPNGMQAYLLSTADGTRLSRAPTEIVQDRNRGDGAIINGISCMACHSDGMRFPPNKRLETFIDEIGPIAAKSTDTRRERLAVEELYVEPHTFQRLVKVDMDRFLRSATKAMPGYDEPHEPVSILYNRYRKPVHADTLGAEFDLSLQQIVRKLNDSHAPSLAVIASQLENGMRLPRYSFDFTFRQIAAALDYTLLDYHPIPFEEFGGGKAAEAPQAIVATKAKANDDAVRELRAITGFGGKDGKLELTLSKDVLKVGDFLDVEVTVNRDAFVRIVHFGADDSVTQMFPNRFQQNAHLRAGQRFKILDGVRDERGRALAWKTEGKTGPESIVAFVSESPFVDAREAGNFSGDFAFRDVKGTVYGTRGAPRIKAVSDGAKPSKVAEARVSYFLKP